MSFSGRLSGGGGSSNDQDNAVVPLSMSTSMLEEDRLSLPIHNQVLISRTIQDGQKHALVEDLIECKSRLFDQSRAMKKLKEAHEAQLVALSRQLLELECGLRKRERELFSVLQVCVVLLNNSFGGFPIEIKIKIRYLIICCYHNFIL